MIPWNRGAPTSFAELFSFYESYFKPLYWDIYYHQGLLTFLSEDTSGILDNIASHWTGEGATEAQISPKIYESLLRSCFKLFRLKVIIAQQQYEELRKIDTSVIEIGQFDRDLHQLFRDIKVSAKEAGRLEYSHHLNEDKNTVLRQWEIVYSLCERLENEFLHNPAVDWARRRGWRIFIRNNLLSFFLGIIASIIASLLYSNFISTP